VRQGAKGYGFEKVCSFRLWHADRVCGIPRLYVVILTLTTPSRSAGAVFNTLKPPSSTSIAIFGCGAVGMSAILAAAALDVSTIIAVDFVQSRLDLAKTFGATHTFLASHTGLLQEIRALTKWKAGVEYAVDATGNVKALKMAYECMAPYGHLCSCGTPGPGHQPPFDIHSIVCEGKTYSGVLEGGSNPPEVGRGRSWRAGG
jgi:aryl-alcohol dehydrogenase